MHDLLFHSALHPNFGRHCVAHAWARKCEAPRGTSLLALFEVPTARDKQSLAPDLHTVDALVDESLREVTGCATEAFDVGGGRQATESKWRASVGARRDASCGKREAGGERRATGSGRRAAGGNMRLVPGAGCEMQSVDGGRLFFGHPNWNLVSPCTRKYKLFLWAMRTCLFLEVK